MAPTTATPVTTPATSSTPVQSTATPPASRAVANGALPATAELPRLQAESFVVDFGKAFSGEQVRRTVTLNATAAGEAEFILNAPAALGFHIAEVRAMGTGATVPSPGSASTLRGANAMAVRKVAQRVTAPPWKLRFSEPTELQVDVVYAPTFDAFNNMAGAKSVQLDTRVRNARGDGSGVPLELRAQFQGLQLGVSVAVKTPVVYQRNPASYVPSQPQPLEPGAVTLSVANLSGAPLTLKIDAQKLPARGLALAPVEVSLRKDESRLVEVPLTYVPVHGSLAEAADDGKAALRLAASNGWAGTAAFRVVQLGTRRWQASGPNWRVGVRLDSDGSYYVYSECHLNFPQTEYNCRMLIDLGNGVRRIIRLQPRINANPRCAYQLARVEPTGAADVMAAAETPKVVLISVDGKVDPAPNTFHHKSVLARVSELEISSDCATQLYDAKFPIRH